MASLVGSGLFSILLVISRTPGVNRLLPAADFFHVALVAHVDLSVLVWFVSLAGMLWSLNCRASRHRLGPGRARAGGRRHRRDGAGALHRRGRGHHGQLHPDADGAAVRGRPAAVRRRHARCWWGARWCRRAPPAPGSTPPARSLRPERRRRRHRGRPAGLRLVLGRGARHAGRQGLLRDPVLGRRPRAAVHLDPADAGGLAVAGRRLRRPPAAQPARDGADVLAGAGGGVRHPGRLPGLRRGLGGAPRHPDLGDAPGRRAGHPAGGAGRRRRAAGRAAAAAARPGPGAPRCCPRCCCSAPAG